MKIFAKYISTLVITLGLAIMPSIVFADQVDDEGVFYVGEVEKKCTRLSGLNNTKCSHLSSVGRVTVEQCKDNANVVCHIGHRGPGIDADFEDRIFNEIIEAYGWSQNYSRDDIRIRYKKTEKSQYCLQNNVYCFKEDLWGPDGLTSYVDQRMQDSWNAFASGDLSGAVCNFIAAGSNGILPCDDEDGVGTISYDLPDENTTFTKFEGDFEPPSPDGYSEGLVVNKSLREYVLNITNFILGFLGLLCVLIIIYGGFVYITAAGDEGKTEAGKKSIIYSIIGIVIIFGAYALVRTVICYAPVGGDDRPSYCKGGISFNIGGNDIALVEQVGESSIVNFENAKQTMEFIINGVIESSSMYISVANAVDYMQNVEIGLQGGIEEVESILGKLQAKSSQYPKTQTVLNTMSLYLSTQSAIASNVEEKSFAELIRRFVYTSVLGGGIDVESQNKAGDTGYEIVLSQSDYEDAYDFMDEYLPKLKSAITLDYKAHIDKYSVYLDEVSSLFSEIQKASDLVIAVDEKLGDLKNEVASAQLIAELVTASNLAMETISTLDFVKVQLASSVRKCNAPCTVLFDALGSFDPTGRSILDDQYHWDLDGNGLPDESVSDLCVEENKSTVSCVYSTPGTYIVTLKVDSANRAEIASGIAMTKIEVGRPLSQAKVLVRTSTDTESPVFDFTAKPVILNGKARFTLEQARSGLLFDATGSLGSANTPIMEYIWTYAGEQFSGSSPTKTIAFNNAGLHKVFLDLVENGVSQRYTIVVDIGSPTAHFSILNPSTDDLYSTGKMIDFDGGTSKSDNGAIDSFTWTVTKGDEQLDELTSTSSTYNFTPTTPGLYTVKLIVEDLKNERDFYEVSLLVKSQKPSACYTYEIPDLLKPNRVVFDNCSADPDSEDVLSYNWIGENAEFVDGTDSKSENPVLQFNRVGKFDVSLTVSDQYLDSDLKMTDTLNEEVEIKSILDISAQIVGGNAFQLSDTGSVDASFKLSSEAATYFEIDFGDGSEVMGKSGEGEVEFNHSYSESGVYDVRFIVYDEDDNENETVQRLFIGSKEKPLPVLDFKADGVEIIPDETNSIKVYRNASIEFDASSSINRDGTGRNLLYSLQFGDGGVSGNKISTYKFDTVGTYNMVFTLTDEATGEFDKANYSFVVEDAEPRINRISSAITSNSLETPVNISAQVEAEDIDGRIVQYTWYMIDAENEASDDAIISSQISNGNKTDFTFHGLGLTGDENRVKICVKLKDDGDNVFDGCANGPFTYVSTITGPNEPPMAKFTIGDNSVQVGDSVVFYDQSSDDTEIKEVYYDVLGNGFEDDQPISTDSFMHTYDKIGEYKVRIKAVDVNGASSVSSVKEVVVESSVDEPTAKIEKSIEYLSVDFTDNSEIDDDTSLEKREWDFDINEDSDGDGDPANDVDSDEANVSHQYARAGNYTVELRIEDAQGNKDSVRTQIRAESEPLDAKLLTDPPASLSDGKVYLEGNVDNLELDFSGSTGPIVRYVIDGNALFDSDGNAGITGNGGKDDDEDQVFDSPRRAVLTYRREWAQPFVIKLTVFDADGNSDSTTKNVLFTPLPAAQLPASQ